MDSRHELRPTQTIRSTTPSKFLLASHRVEQCHFSQSAGEEE